MQNLDHDYQNGRVVNVLKAQLAKLLQINGRNSQWQAVPQPLLWCLAPCTMVRLRLGFHYWEASC